ncbi:MAG: hypothetical protein H0X36_09185 [Sphingomonadaceae bacterium]|nr:hypothetical protein [Sphingomonadaceae bacterium]
MKKIALAIALAASTSTSGVHAQAVTADDLVAKNLAARGGADRFAAIKSLRFDGKLIYPGDFELTYQETRSATGALRVDSAIQGLTLVQAYDGKSGWKINPFEGRKDAERLTDDEARALADSALIRGPLLNAAAAGSTVTYMGREDFDGTLAYKLRVSEKDGDEFVYLLDPDTMLEIKITETRRIRGAQVVTESELGDYEKVAGVYYPMSIESWSQGQSGQRARTIIATATANIDAAASLFAQPAAPAARAPSGK